MQNAQTEASSANNEDANDDLAKKKHSKPGKPTKALIVVTKKLSKNLSFVTIVNEFILKRCIVC